MYLYSTWNQLYSVFLSICCYAIPVVLVKYWPRSTNDHNILQSLLKMTRVWDLCIISKTLSTNSRKWLSEEFDDHYLPEVADMAVICANMGQCAVFWHLDSRHFYLHHPSYPGWQCVVFKTWEPRKWHHLIYIRPRSTQVVSCPWKTWYAHGKCSSHLSRPLVHTTRLVWLICI